MSSKATEQESVLFDRSPVLVTISNWVNERAPPLDGILTAHDVARLMRRPKWALFAMSLIGEFPKEARFHGRRIGWNRRDVYSWLYHRKPMDQPLRLRLLHARPHHRCLRTQKHEAATRFFPRTFLPQTQRVSAPRQERLL